MKEISVFDIPGFQIGHATDLENGTGCTAILAPAGATAGVDVRGGGPATRETDLLRPENMVQQIHAVVLSGGSAFGLESSAGVMQYLAEKGIGFAMKDITVPIVCEACLFDLGIGNPKAFPDKAMGYAAAKASETRDESMGNVGAGTGASVGKLLGIDTSMKSGLGTCALQAGNLMVGAIVGVNACGDVYEPNSSIPVAGLYDRTARQHLDSETTLMGLYESMCGQNTTIACILTNAKLTKAEANKVAAMAQDALARTIRPVHTSNDGDTVFAMATGEVEAATDLVGVMAVKALEQAIVRGCKAAAPAYGLPSWSSFQKQ